MPTDIRTGGSIAGFELEALLGEGAMAAVYLAREATSGARVALKVLRPELAHDLRFRRRFLRESTVAAGLDHPHVVPTLASGEEDGHLYLVMAYVECSDLREVLRREGRLEPRRALDLLAQVAAALDAAHAAELVHRDVKPGNILVTERPEREHAYVCDFGLARHVSSMRSLTGDRGFVGTIDYVPPEQIEGSTIDHRADIYSLGCVLYECLAGARPFERESELSVVFAHLNEPPPRLSNVRPDLPAEFDAVFATALAKSPAARYSSCAELVEAALDALQGKSKRVPRRSRRRAVLAAAAALAAAGGATAGLVVATTPHAKAAEITPTSIAGATLGLPERRYKQLFGERWGRAVLTESEHVKLTFFDRDLAVYFKGLTDTAVQITTWNRTFRTAEGVGPCSTLAQVKKAYGKRLRPSKFNTQDGQTYAYTVGSSLIFAFNGPPPYPAQRVTAVGLYYGDAPGAGDAGGSLSFAGYISIIEADGSNCAA
jgi:tRNA A-37 threonylcarbamoyl transferase component Bud32